MSAEMLRKAAALMRERAEDASLAVGDDHWNWDTGWCDPHGTTYTVGNQGGAVAEALFEEVAEYLCPLRPAFLEAVADWLDRVAVDGDNGYDASNDDNFAAALHVARAYLGAES